METLRIAARALGAHKMRSFLTLLGVIIGVTTVVTVVSIISGMNSYINEKVFQLSPDVLIFTRFGIITSREEFMEAIKRRKIDLRDVQAIENRCQSCGMVGTQASTRQNVKRGANTLERALIHGTSANMAELNNLDLEAGRFFTPSETMRSAPVAVIGTDMRDQLFRGLDPIGRDIKLSGRTLKVVGLLTKQGSVLGQNQDNRMFIPISTFRKIYGSRSDLDIFVKPAGGLAGIQRTEDEVRLILRSRRHTPFNAKDPFGIVTAESLQQLWKQISGGAFALMVFISGISLVVGGIVITNIMLVSVIERTREIGIRRAIGAQKSDIRNQFLTEAVMLSLVGGLLGVAVGALVSKIVATMTPLPTLVRPSLVLTGLAIAMITGVLAGYFPARRAANLPPIDSLRWE